MDDISTRLPSVFRQWGGVALLLAGATGAGQLLEPHVSLTSQAMIYVLAVVIASYKLDWVKSAVCAVGAVTALNFFFIPPRFTFEVENQEHLIALITLLAVALVISRLADGLRRETVVARRNEWRARQLQTLATDLSGVTTIAKVLTLGQAALAAAFSGPCMLALATPERELEGADAIEPAVRDGLRCCLREGAVLGPGTGRWPGLLAWYLPLGDKGHLVGAACVRPALAGDEDGREHAKALCALLGQALWRLRLAESMRAAQEDAQRQQLQSTLLAAISHDLRTPLAVILGAASALQAQRDKLTPAEQARLLGSLVDEANYLNTVADNTLQLVRLETPDVRLQRDWESVEEIVGAVLARVRRHDPARRIRSHVPEGLPLIKADPVLLSQLLGNLLDNALKYGEGEIELTAGTSPQVIEVCVADHGPGIPQSERELLFQPYSRGDRAGHHGAGLGLAVCRAIALAHGGQLSFAPREGGGSRFCLILPRDAAPPLVEQA